MKVVIVGSGGREHALAWRLRRSPRVDAVAACPGNGGLSRLGPCWADLDPTTDTEALLARIRDEGIDLVVIGPEAPLVAGLADRLRSEGVAAFGPSAEASRLEGSKAHAKQFMERWGIPTAPFVVVDDPARVDEALARFGGDDAVVKASGLAAGKGVIVALSLDEARAAARAMLSGERFGPAGRRVVIEERLDGIGMTMLVFVSGEQYRLLHSCQDYKPLEEGNRGPNTGGMGAYSPTNLFTQTIRERILGEVLEPTLHGLAAEGIDFRGILYLGLMLTSDGPRLLEYNVRFGDPEAQPLLMRLRTDPISIFESIETGTLQRLELDWDPRAAVCVVMASAGYPGSYERGGPIRGPVISDLDDPVQVFHAGTRWNGECFETAGGRVLGVTALADDVGLARARAYSRVEEIDWPGKVFRGDIAALA